MRAVRGALCFALLLSTPAWARTSPDSGPALRLIANDFKLRVDDDTYERYHASLSAEVADALDGAGDPSPADTDTIVLLPEAAGILSVFVGSRGEASRAELGSGRTEAGFVKAMAALEAQYLPQQTYYESRCPGIPRVRLLFLAVADTIGRAFVEGTQASARKHKAWIVASGFVPALELLHATTDPTEVALLADPEGEDRSYAYRAANCGVWNMTLVISPDGAIAAVRRKAHLAAFEREPDQLGLSAGQVAETVQPVETPFGPLGILTGADAWAPDLVERLEIEGMRIFLQPEAGQWAAPSDQHLWAPDNMHRSMWSMVQWQPETAWGAIAYLTGNVGGDPTIFDGTATIGRDAAPGEVPAVFELGRLPVPGLVARAPWAFSDPPDGVRLEDVETRRGSLCESGKDLRPGAAGDNAYLSGSVSSELPTRRARPPAPRVAALFQAASVAIDPSPSGPQWSPALVASEGDGSLLATWTDLRDGFEAPFVARLTRGGTWDPARRAGERPPAPNPTEGETQGANRYRARVASAGGGALVAAWADAREGSWRIYSTRSTDGGATWSTSAGVDAASEPAATNPCGPRSETTQYFHAEPALATLGNGDVVAAWSDLRDPYIHRVIRIARSRDGGATWESDVAVAPLVGANQWSPALAAGEGGSFVVAWQDQRDGWNQILAAAGSSSENGLELDPAVHVAAAPVQQWQPAVAVGAGGQVAIAFVDGADPEERRVRVALTSFDALARGDAPRSVDFADRFAPSPVRQARPAIAFSGEDAFVAFQDDRAGDWDILVARVRPGRPKAVVRIDDGPQGAAARVPGMVALPGGRLAVAWEDMRSGSPQIRMTLVEATEKGRLQSAA